jgi:GLPGLI family protein
MKKILSILFVILIVHSAKSQIKTGIVYYGEVQSLGLGAPVGKDYNAILVFDSEKSLFITRQDSLEQLSTTSDQKKFYFATATNKQGFQYYNDLKTNTLYSRDLGFTYVKEDLPNIAWSISEETKDIGDFKCQKATAAFRGRDYTAWFTTNVPLPYGHWKLHGLPGLILEAYDTHKEIYWYFKEMSYPSPYHYLLKPISNPKADWMSFADFKDKQLEVFKQAEISGRMMTEKMGIKSYPSEDMSGSYIEVFPLQKD